MKLRQISQIFIIRIIGNDFLFDACDMRSFHMSFVLAAMTHPCTVSDIKMKLVEWKFYKEKKLASNVSACETHFPTVSSANFNWKKNNSVLIWLTCQQWLNHCILIVTDVIRHVFRFFSLQNQQKENLNSRNNAMRFAHKRVTDKNENNQINKLIQIELFVISSSVFLCVSFYDNLYL